MRGVFLKKSSTPIEGIFEPSFNFLSSNLALANTLVSSEQTNVIIQVIDVTSEPVRVHKGTVVANLHQVEDILPLDESDGEVCNTIGIGHMSTDDVNDKRGKPT